MKISKDEEHIIKNIKSYKPGFVYIYFALGFTGIGLVFFFTDSPALSILTLFLSGLLCGIAVEKFYNHKIYRLCLKLYQDFISH